MNIAGDRLRILHISSVYPPHVVGGAEKVVEMLAEAQAARGHHVAAAYLSQSDAPGRRNGVTVMPQPDRNLIWMGDVLKRPRPMRTANKLHQAVNRRAARDFAGAIAAFRPDIVHTHSMVELPPMIWSRAAAGPARTVHTLHDYDLVCSRASLFRNGGNCAARHPACWAMSLWKERFARHLDGIAAVSQAVLDEHRRFGLFDNLPPTQARVIWNAANRPAASLEPAQRSGEIVFGFLGRLVPEKGLGVLIEACRALPERGWRLRVAGRSPQGDAGWRAMADGLPIEFAGFVDPAAFLSGVDVLVVPSIWREPFGLTVIEAFAQSVPVIGSRFGAVAELVGTIGDDWLVAPDDSAALAARMRAVLDTGRAALPGAAAFAPVLDQVSPDRMVDAYDDLYRAVSA